MTIEDFILEYGTEAPRLLVEQFILMAPPFDGRDRLELVVKQVMLDLEEALKSAVPGVI